MRLKFGMIGGAGGGISPMHYRGAIIDAMAELTAGKHRGVLYRVDGAKQGNLCTAVCRKCKTQIIWAKMCIQSRRFVVYFRLVLHIHVVLVFTWEKSAGTAGKLDAESGCSSRDQSETAHCVWLTGKLQVKTADDALCSRKFISGVMESPASSPWFVIV